MTDDMHDSANQLEQLRVFGLISGALLHTAQQFYNCTTKHLFHCHLYSWPQLSIKCSKLFITELSMLLFLMNKFISGPWNM